MTILQLDIFRLCKSTHILISIFIGYVYLIIFQSRLNNFWNAYTHFLILACLWPLTSHFWEYGTLTIAMMVLGYSVKNSLISLPIAAFTAAYTSFLYTIIIYFNDFKTPEFIATAIVIGSIYFSLTFKNFRQTNNLNLIISKIQISKSLKQMIYMILISFHKKNDIVI